MEEKFDSEVQNYQQVSNVSMLPRQLAIKSQNPAKW